jgi:hypothetical protein
VADTCSHDDGRGDDLYRLRRAGRADDAADQPADRPPADGNDPVNTGRVGNAGRVSNARRIRQPG